MLKESLLSLVCSNEWEREIVLSLDIAAMDVTVPKNMKIKSQSISPWFYLKVMTYLFTRRRWGKIGTGIALFLP